MKLNSDGLIPAIVQDAETRKVLMLGYMNEDALQITIETGHVTFYSRSKGRLWTKGESSGNFLKLVSWSLDCDEDALLVQAVPQGPTCHKGTDTCWQEKNEGVAFSFLRELENVISNRKAASSEKSYTAYLFQKGTHKIAQKVGEEAVELVIDALRDNDEAFMGEAADLLYHYLILLADRGKSLKDVVTVLENRHEK